MKANDLLKRVQAHVKALGAEIDAAKASGEYRAWLECCARFHKYSLHNTLLILCQKPDATRVAGFRAWKKLGRHVRKGEKGIAILAPCIGKRKETVTDAETGQESEQEQAYKYFIPVHVFDVSQTDGQPLPTLDTSAHGADGGLLDALQVVASARGIVVEFQALTGERHGYSAGGKVVIDTRLEPAGRFKTLCHELAHEALHQGDDDRTGRAEREHEAEAVAYVVCRHFGIDGGSAKYLATWGADTEALMERFERIHETAAGLINDLEAKLAGLTSKAAA